jgi:poly(A) polymerase
MQRLARQPWMSAAQRVLDALEAARPGSARFVGGCVRNALLGEPVADIDIATQLTPDEVERVMRAANIAVHPTGVEHGTLTVVADHRPYEVTTLRRDVETDGRRAVVAFTQEWAEDAQRRDFRINALYADRDGQVFDPTGGGLEDLQHRRIIFVGDPETRLREDYLRILRFFRFFAWYGQGEPDAAGLAACAKLRAGLATISAERIWIETKKLLAAPKPMPSLTAMASSGVLMQLFPEAKGLHLVEKLVALEAAQGLAPDPMLRFLALFWKDAPAVHAVANRLKLSNDERQRLNWSAADETPLSATTSAAELRAAIYRVGSQVIRDRALLGWASDGQDGWGAAVRLADNWPRPVLPVSGGDLITAGLSPGPAMGQALRKAEDAWIASDFSLDRDALLALVR